MTITDPAEYRRIHDIAAAAYEAAVPVDYRYSAIALRKAVDAALSAVAPQAGDNAEEPVAWRWESAYGGEPLIGKWNVATVKPTRFSDATAFACEPLYTHPCTSTPVVSQPHADDLAVDRFAAAMKAKLAEKRAQGYGGWDDPEDCTIGWLSKLLRKHVDKGDPIDVGNFAMMVHQRGGSIE